MDPWKVAADERAKHDSQFNTLTQGSHITGEQARGFFMQSNLPQMVLGQIWGMADLTSDGKMDRKEFSIAMTLIKRKLQGYQLPPTLPPSMLVEPSLGGTLPHGMSGLSGTLPSMPAMSSATLPNRLPSQTTNASLGVAPGSPARTADGSSDWAVPHASRLKYNQLFNREDRKRLGYLTGFDSRQLLMSTGLPQNVLAQIWSLADVDADGRLTSEEFSLAMFLADMVKMGQPLPMSLPPNFIPPSMRSRSRSNSGVQPTPAAAPLATAGRSDTFGDLIPGGFGSAPMPQPVDNQPVEDAAALTPLTLEDKRRENFAKGNAELEKRRAELREQQRKEEEARQAKERAEQEKREAVRREQERKRLAEQERLLEKQRQMEAEREEQRRKAMEARETARKEMERQRQQEWERQRKHALLAEKKRHEEAVQLLESQVNNLKYEIETMDNKKNELATRIQEAKANVISNTVFIDGMRSTRDGLLSTVSALEVSKREKEQLHAKLCTESSQVKQSLQTRQAANPISDNFKQHQSMHSAKSQQVETLRKALAEVDTNKSSLNIEVEATRSTLSKLKESISKLQQEQSRSRDQVQNKRSEWEREKQCRVDDKIKSEREVQQKAEAERQKRVEEERKKAEEEKKKVEEEKKKKEEDKWSAFKDLDFSAPTATTSVPGNAPASDNDWFANTPTKSQDMWGSSQQSSTTSDMWSGASQSKGTDLFADNSWMKTSDSSGSGWSEPAKTTNDAWGSSSTSSWSKPSEPSSNDVWGKATSNDTKSSDSTNLFGKSSDPFANKSKPTGALLPPPKTPTKKETTFGVEMGGADLKLTAAAVKPAATDTGSRTRKVEIYQVQFDFGARNADELDLKEDDKVKVYPDEQESAEPGWISGWKGDKAGIFPANYVKKVREVFEPITSSDVATKAASSAADSGAGMSRSESAFDEVRSSPTLEGGSPAPDGLTCVAIYQWRAKKDNHLSFNQGDEIKVLMQQDMWWQGSLANGQRGWFPKSYVKTVDKPAQQPAIVAPAADASSRFYDQVPTVQSTPAAKPAAAKPAAPAVYDEPADSGSSRYYDQVPGGPESSAPSSQGERYLALHDYQSDVAGDLTFNAGDLIVVTGKDGEWWTGQVEGRTGIFPANYVSSGDDVASPAQPVSKRTNNLPSLPNRQSSSDVVSKANAPNTLSVVKRHPRAAPRKPDQPTSPIKAAPSAAPAAAPASTAGSQAKEIGRVIAAYEATGQEQLSLKPGQLIHIKKKSPSGWWEGELTAKGQKKQIGWFPSDYVKLMPSAAGKTGDRSSTPASELMDSPRSADVTPSPTPAVTQAAPAVQPAPVAHQVKVQASYPYSAQNDDELSFQQGDIIAIVNKDDPDWWTGQLGGVTGVFPSNYVQHYTEPS